MVRSLIPAVTGTDTRICSPAFSHVSSPLKSIHASSRADAVVVPPGIEHVTRTLADWPATKGVKKTTPSSSSRLAGLLSSPSESSVGWPSGSPSTMAPRAKPSRRTCRAPSLPRSVGYLPGASPKSMNAVGASTPTR